MAEHTIGKLKIELTLDTSKFHQNINKIKEKISDVKAKSIQSLNSISTTVKTKIDGMTDKFDEMKKSSNYLTSAFGEIGSELIDIITPGRVVAAIIAAIGIAFGMTIKTGSEMNKTFERIQVATGATGQALNNLQSSLRKIIEISSSTADVLSSAFIQFNNYLDTTSKKIENLTILIAKYADITQEDAGATSEIISRMFNSWKISPEKYEQTMNVLFGISQKTGISLNEMAQSLTEDGSAFRKVGYSIEEAAIQLAAFNKCGYDATTLTDILYSSLDRLKEDGLRPTKKNYQSLVDFLKRTKDTDFVFETFGSSYYSYKSIDALKATSDEIKFLTENINTYNNALNDSIQLQEGGAIEAWTKLSNKLANVSETIFEKLEPAITYIINLLSNFIDIITPIVEILSKLSSMILEPITLLIKIIKLDLTVLYHKILKPIYDWVVEFIDRCKPLKAIFNAINDIGKALSDAWDWLTADENTNGMSKTINDAKNAIDNYCDSLDTAIEKTDKLAKTDISSPQTNIGNYQANNYNEKYINNTSYYNNIKIEGNNYPYEELARLYNHNQAMNAIKARY